jgi:hypothetical protein
MWDPALSRTFISMTATTALESVTIRPATASDTGALERLAALDSSRALGRDVLLAEVDGQVRAALRTSDDAVVADPFVRTADLVDLLAARAHRMRSGRVSRLRPWDRLGHLTVRPSV